MTDQENKAINELQKSLYVLNDFLLVKKDMQGTQLLSKVVSNLGLVFDLAKIKLNENPERT